MRSLLLRCCSAGTALFDITPHIRQLVQQLGVTEGFVNVLSRHTTTAVAINEYETRLLDDIRQVCRPCILNCYAHKAHASNGSTWPMSDSSIVSRLCGAPPALHSCLLSKKSRILLASNVNLCMDQGTWPVSTASHRHQLSAFCRCIYICTNGNRCLHTSGMQIQASSNLRLTCSVAHLNGCCVCSSCISLHHPVIFTYIMTST